MSSPTEKDRSPFWRPSPDHNCGRLPCGKPCQQGPDASGQCQTSSECIPVKRGARWNCTRAASAGGPCSDGPGPQGSCPHPLPRCTPVPSPRRRYRTIIVSVFLLLLGGLLASYALDPAGGLSPGPLSGKHAAAGTDCHSCHRVDGDTHPVDVVGALAGGDKSTEQHCVGCHAGKQSPHAAHDGAVLKAAGGGRLGTATAMRCQDCHQEHDGPLLPTAQVEQQVCNACHQNVQHAFPDHSSFGDYPYQRPAQVRFDHRVHLEKHFPAKGKSGAAAACVTCHGPTTDGRYMTTAKFPAMCGDCHGKSLAAEPVTLLAMPTIDRAALAAIGVDLPGWPEEGDDTVFPGSALLTIENLTGGKVRATQLRNVDVSDLGGADAAQVKLVGEVAALTLRWFGEAGLASADSALPFARLLGQGQPGQWSAGDGALTLQSFAHADPILTRALAPNMAVPADAFPKPCGTCHTPAAGAGHAIGWKSAARSVKAGSMVPFSHRQHLVAAGDRGCQSCHQYAAPVAAPAAAADRKPGTARGFAPMDTATCATCHQGDSEGGTCGTCHQYHREAAAFSPASPHPAGGPSLHAPVAPPSAVAPSP